MGIKQSISLLALFWGVSFSASAKYMQVTGVGNYDETAFRCTGLSMGSVIDTSAPPNVSGVSWEQNGRLTKCLSSRVSSGHYYVEFNYIGNDKTGYLILSDFGDCPEGTEYNPATHQCEEPPDEPFCSKESTQQEIASFEAKCSADGGNSSVLCNDLVDPPDFRMSCDIPPPPPDGCEPGSSSWPACMDDDPEPDQCDSTSPDWVDSVGKCCNESNNYCDEKPPEPCTIFNSDAPHCQNDDDDIAPPTPDDDLEDPEFPDFPDTDGSGDSDIPEPPVDDETDANKAIKALNKDMNKQLTQINKDLNGNHEISMKALGSLKSSLDLNTKSVVDSANHTASAVNSQTSVLTELGNKTNGLLKSINGLLKGGFDGLNESLEGLKDAFKVDPVAVNPKHLYESGDLSRLRSEVESLKSDYEAELRSMKSYFNFTSGVSSGDFNSHDLALNWHGHAVTATNQVFVSMRDNAGIIAAVVLFVFGMAGIKEIVRA